MRWIPAVQSARSPKLLITLAHGAAGRLCLLGVALLGLLPTAHAQTAVLRTLYSFQGAPDGQNPSGALLRGMDGNLYGATSAGGSHGYGTIFMLTPAGSPTILHSFNSSDGSTPRGTLLEDSNGNLYGTTSEGGDNENGTVFELTYNNVFFSLYSFSEVDGNGYNADGQYPRGELSMDASGNLYGACANGGGANDGTVFELTTGGTLDTLYSFNGYDGANPAAGPVLGSTGLLYGTTGSNRSGDNDTGTVYSVDAAHQSLTSIYNFSAEDSNGYNADGVLPQGALVQGTDGYLYGTTLAGGIAGSGTLFKVTPDGSVFKTLHNFSAVSSGENADGYDCLGALVQGSDGNFYGEAQFGGANGSGTLYQVTPAGVFTTLYSFEAVSSGVNADGTTPGSALIEGNNGTFYGIASYGGASGVGTVFELTVSPAVTSATTASASVGKAFSYQIKGTNTPTSFSVSGLTDGLKFNDNTGLVSGTPTAAGTVKLIVYASNSAGTGSRNVTVTITGPPVITSATTASATVGDAFTYHITASNSPTSFGATNLPGGLTVNTSTGIISGTPTTAGSFAVGLSATNGAGTGTATLTLTVTKIAPVITSATTASATYGDAFSYQITVKNYSASFAASGLPAGLSLNTTTGLISGTPTVTGTFSVALSATNSAGTGKATLTLTVSKIAPAITSATTASATVGDAFSYQITAKNAPVSYSATGLPAGLSANTTTGLISGTPTANGTFSVTLSATNSAGTGTAALTLTVTKIAPVITSATTATGTQGKAFSYQITVKNYSASFAASGLPTGLSLNTTTGLISGTPTATGTFSVALSATNSAGTGRATLTLTVAAP